jgi:hypothetical protein
LYIPTCAYWAVRQGSGTSTPAGDLRAARSVVAAIGEDAIPSPSIDQTLKELTCDLAKLAISQVASTFNSSVGQEISNADTAMQAMGGQNIQCP